jgi:hypothetical protein
MKLCIILGIRIASLCKKKPRFIKNLKKQNFDDFAKNYEENTDEDK